MTEASAQRPAPPPPIQAQRAQEPTGAPAAPTPPPASAEPKPARPPQSAGELLQSAIGAAPSMRMRMMLEKLAPIGLDDGVLKAGVAPDVRNLVEMSRGTIEGLLAQAAGQPIRIELQASEAESPQAGSGSEPASENSRRQVAGAGETGSAAADHPLVKRARELFDAGIVNVRPKQSGPRADR
ncbi:MAG: hypothetical protein JJU33_06195 [Phycisphaerales bacterium]|nr:hypothetical protein [Phycisphaerales bacterium]